MAAPMKTCLLNFRKLSFSWTACRYYARKRGNNARNFITPEEDVKKLKGRIRDPRINAYLPFIPEDPVQESLSMAAKRTKSNENSDRDFYKQSEFSRTVNENISKGYRKPEKTLRGSNSTADNVRAPRPGRDDQSQNSISFEKLEEADKRFGRLIMAARCKKNRGESGEIVLEGKLLIKDALEVGAKLKVLYFTKMELVEELPTELLGEAKIYKVLYRHLKLWSDVETPQGLLGIFEMPTRALRPNLEPIPLTLICDSVRDGGNLGTLIRTAAAVGCQNVIALKGCVDIWNGKVLRSAAGSHYRVSIMNNRTWSQVLSVLPPADDIRVYLADSNQVTNEKDHDETMATDSSYAIQEIEEVNNSELSDVETDFEDEGDNNDSDCDFYNKDDSSAKKNNEKSIEKIEEEPSYRSFKVLSAYKNAPLNSTLYDMVDYSKKHTVLVVSGETSGLSLPAKKLAYDHFGECVHLPMCGGVDSLNCAIAGSVIMYEIAKQYRTVSIPKSEDH